MGRGGFDGATACMDRERLLPASACLSLDVSSRVRLVAGLPVAAVFLSDLSDICPVGMVGRKKRKTRKIRAKVK
ncbi:hypothetical protein Naga_101113g1 [Nannochloropsis gaditana]|uniref:Uncharacterized protein n=1 Tax=Nannochloropsis gaditana TaxID=72520 RepID=W7TU12_9STRA|nr:hypothetical protein Naga_101113g1 [Nannochloropsis gaditana]